MFARKPVITHNDAGGALEFVQDGRNGRVVPPDPEQLAEAIDSLFCRVEQLREMGEQGRRMLDEKQVNWDYAIDRLTETARG